MSKITISVRSHFTKEQIADLLDSASRGSAYWCKNELGYTSVVNKVFNSDSVEIVDSENDNKVYTLNVQAIKRGLTCMAKKYPSDFADFVKGDYDMNTGDIFLQCCLFNEVIYS